MYYYYYCYYYDYPGIIIIIIQLLLLNTGLVYHFCKIKFLFFNGKKLFVMLQ